MRIILALQMPLLQQGGVEVLVKTLIEDLYESHEIFLVSKDTDHQLREAGLHGKLAGHFQVPEGILPVSWNRDLLDWISTNRVDLAHFHLAGTYGWKARSFRHCPITVVAESGTPVVCTNHSATCFFSTASPPRPLWRKWAAAANAWPGKARQLAAVKWEACVSRHDLDLTLRYFPNFSNKLFHVYHSRLDTSLPVAEKKTSANTILNVGTLSFHKGQHLLAEAFARIASDFPEWNLKLVGYHAEKACVERIRAIVSSANLEKRVELLGPNPDPAFLFHECGIYVQPSLVEGLGLSLQEAMFHARPCIGSRCGGIPELIADPAVGMLFEPGEVGELAEALSLLISNPPMRDSLGKAARDSIITRGMTRQAMSALYQKLYQETLAKP